MFDDWNQIECPLNFSVILWKSWTSWRTRVNSSEPFQWPFMTCKYCHFPTCFCSETDAVRGLGRKTVVGSDNMDTMWFHWNNVKIIGQRLEFQKVIPLLPFQLCIMMFLIMVSFNSHWFPGFPRSWLESGWTAAIWLHLLRSSWDSLRKCRIGLYHTVYQNTFPRPVAGRLL